MIFAALLAIGAAAPGPSPSLDASPLWDAYRTALQEAGPDLPAFAEKQTKRANLGNPEAQFILGKLYFLGNGVNPDCRVAAKWFEKVAAKGYTEAHLELVWLYSPTSMSSCTSAKKAVAWAESAAKRGNTSAMVELGYAYSMPWAGIAEDDERGFNWFRQAALRANVHGEINLGRNYMRGEGTEIDFAAATAWLEKAYKHGNRSTEFDLATMYLQGGHGLQIGYAEAAKWFRRSFNGGRSYGSAAVSLGWLYFNGKGVPRDVVKAYMWTSMASDDQNALANMKAIAAQMTRPQLDRARAEAQKCKDSGFKDCD